MNWFPSTRCSSPTTSSKFDPSSREVDAHTQARESVSFVQLTMMKCTRCRSKVEVYLRQHNTGFCRPCFVLYFRRQVERTIHQTRMLHLDEEVLVAVSGGKD